MKKSLLLIIILSISLFSFSQNRTIEGKVYNMGGGVLTGVRVFAKEAPAIFTLTNEKGSYKLNIPEEVTKLVFSYTAMSDKVVEIGEFSTLNVKLSPSNFKKLRFGLGFAFGTSKFSIFNAKSLPNVPDTTTIRLTPIAINANLFYKLNRSLDLQALLTDGLNIPKLNVDTVISMGDTIIITDNVMLNRFAFAVLVNYNFNISKTKNHSAFVGFGPQYQYFSFFKTNTVGARFHAGVNINNYGLTTRLFAAIDVSNGEFGENIAFVDGFTYKYLSGRIGITFIF